MRSEKKPDHENIDYLSVGWMLVISILTSITLNWPGIGLRAWKIIQTVYYIHDFLNTYAVMMFLLLLILSATTYLDKKFTWEKDFKKRIILQIALGVVIPVIACYLLGILYFYIFEITYISHRYIRNTSSILLVLAILINLLYIATYQIIMNQRLTKETVPDLPRSKFLLVPDGTGETKVLISNISYIYLLDEATHILTFNESEQYIWYIPLDDLYHKLDPENFFRANRNCIVSQKAIKKYSTIENRRLLVELLFKTDRQIIVSREKSGKFKSWFKGN